MGIEIERKFLLQSDAWRSQVQHSERMVQGYLVGAQAVRDGTASASVRVRRAGEQAWLNIKSATLGIQRDEYEYPVPLADAEAMLSSLCKGALEKIRHHVVVDGALFEIDEFLGDNQGLIVAEIELDAPDMSYPRPAWLGREVSTLPRYYNVNLSDHPYVRWTLAERDAVDAVVRPDAGQTEWDQALLDQTRLDQSC
ncbi:CYTH domain-containing protein [Dyella tabacisoli]|uniref:CYTH domain-containing protein n=1 Tax=Dyella tabacisoli TaxID=2282381 RepID=A0A369UT99_9GAMM|nr:CYTH domain-containing protein [Dyella tabacisoli]RDD83275.1 CYTH domain-containing protein [Dyella tabacisoli]